MYLLKYTNYIFFLNPQVNDTFLAKAMFHSSKARLLTLGVSQLRNQIPKIYSMKS